MLPGDLMFDRILFSRLQAREEHHLTRAESMAHFDTMTFMKMERKRLIALGSRRALSVVEPVLFSIPCQNTSSYLPYARILE